MSNYFSVLSLSYFSHQFILLFCLFIWIFVILVFLFIFYDNSYNTFFSSSFLLEYFWTVLPLFIVILLFLPLFYFSYYTSFNYDSYFIVANQWFWDTFNLNNFSSIHSDFSHGLINSIYLNSYFFFNFYLTSNDVLHAFSLPSLFVMVDLVPGVIHNLNIFFPFIGVYIVYCAQICGSHHSAMPLYFILN